MKVSLIIVLSCFVCSFSMQEQAGSQVTNGSSSRRGLFDSDEVLAITLKGNTRELMNDRSDYPRNHSFVLSCTMDDNSQTSIPVEIKTRGHFRKLKENCYYPPLLIQFPGTGNISTSLFSGQSKLKLVMPCKGDEYVVREWLVYKIYNLITPKSFRARLVKVRFDDTNNKKTAEPFYGILLEEEKQMAARNNAVAVEEKLKPEQTQPDAFLTMAVFEYLIGNTDWSVEYLQNIKLLKTESSSQRVTVPYDFDHAGIVDAPYALPADELQMRSVRERRYRGYCMKDMKAFEGVIALFNKLKNDIYGLYTNCTLLDPKYIKSTTKYLDEFYVTINNPKAWQKDFAYPCDKRGTGNVVIKGLKED